MNDEIKEILDRWKCYIGLTKKFSNKDMELLIVEDIEKVLDYITNLQQENKIKDTNWESLKYYLEKLYYKDYIEEAISDDIDKKIKELESKVEIKGYQKDIKALQQENERLKRILDEMGVNPNQVLDYKSRCEKASEYIDKQKNKMYKSRNKIAMFILMKLENILQGEKNATNKDL